MTNKVVRMNKNGVIVKLKSNDVLRVCKYTYKVWLGKLCDFYSMR